MATPFTPGRGRTAPGGSHKRAFLDLDRLRYRAAVVRDPFAAIEAALAMADAAAEREDPTEDTDPFAAVEAALVALAGDGE